MPFMFKGFFPDRLLYGHKIMGSNRYIFPVVQRPSVSFSQVKKDPFFYFDLDFLAIFCTALLWLTHPITISISSSERLCFLGVL